MKSNTQRVITVVAIAVFTVFGVIVLTGVGQPGFAARAQSKSTPTPTPVFDLKAAIAARKASIKGREMEPAGKVFKNVKDFAKVPAGNLLAIMEFGYARSLGVNCTHCHTPENWASEEKTAKKTAREMRAMSDKINSELLPSIKAFEGREGRARAVVNCTTCHRGEVKPATSLSSK